MLNPTITPPILETLLENTNAAELAHIAAQHGLTRVPGLNRETILSRIRRNISDDALLASLVSLRFGGLTIDDLLDRLLNSPLYESIPAGRPRLDQVSVDEAILLRGEPQHWVYTIRGYEVRLDLQQKSLHCDCAYFAFSAPHRAMCKHLVTAFRLVPQAYSRPALIEMLLTGGAGWRFSAAT